jgi:dihydrofolate reductase
MRLTIIAALAKNQVLGKDNDLIWHLPEDLKHFKNLTSGHHIIMGRKTFESIGKPLPKRVNIVVTRDRAFSAAGVLVAHTLQEAIAKASGDVRPFIVGGAQIYAAALPMVSEMELTMIDRDFEGDAFFPDVDWDAWELKQKTSHEAPDGYAYHFCHFVRKSDV